MRVDPYDYPLDLQCNGDIYVDVGVTFAFKMNVLASQMCMDTITLCKRKVWSMNYLDDYVGVVTSEQADSNVLPLFNLLQYVGLPFNQKNSVINCLGISINPKTVILKIPDEKEFKINQLCLQWTKKTVATKINCKSLLAR